LIAQEATMASVTKKKMSGPKMPPEVKAAYAEIEGGVRNLGKSIAEIRRVLARAEKKIEADAKARIRELRQDARTQLASLQSREREAAKTLRSLKVAAEGSWQEVKQAADLMLADAKATAGAVVERFRAALGG
jgi:hypothetical protein